MKTKTELWYQYNAHGSTKAPKHAILANRPNQQCVTHWATLTVTGRQARARPISSTPRKKKLELEARNGRVAGRQLFTSETYKQKSERNRIFRNLLWLWPMLEKHVRTKHHLFDIEDKEVFNGADGGQQRAVERADPADGLTVDDLQHVLRNSKLLLAPPLSQATVTVHHYQPEESEATKTLLEMTQNKGWDICTQIRIYN